MSTYAPFPAEQSLVPPGIFADTRFFYFFLRARNEALQALCDRYFNERAGSDGVHYRSLGLVALAFTHVSELRSADEDAGLIRYKDIAFWVPVWGGAKGVGAHLCLFPPFIFVDNPATMVTGREVFGLPKQMGEFEMPLDLDELTKLPLTAPAFTADVFGTLQKGGPVDRRRLIEVRREPMATGKLSTAMAGGMRAIARLLDDGPGLAGIDLPEGIPPLQALGLQQMRDVGDPSRACHQAIVEAPLETVEVHTASLLLDRFDVTLMDVSSHPVAAVLGLAPGPVTAALAVYLQGTMVMRAGMTVWRSR